MAGIFYLHSPHFCVIIIPQRRITMPQIIPIRDLKNTTEISDLCHNSTEPIYITKNGYGDMVVMSMSAYEKQMEKIEMFSKIMEGKAQSDSGELIDGVKFVEKLRKKYAE